jgi:hypothetical protein
MGKRYAAYAALLAVVILLFTGCDALIGNVFKQANLGQPSLDPEKLKAADTATLLAQSGIASGSVLDTFIDAVISDDVTKNAVLATLQTTVTSGTPSEAQAAQALILDIKLADIGADEVVDNLNSVLGYLMNLGSNDGEELKTADIIDALLPASLTDDTAKLATFIDDIKALAADVDTLAAKINANGGTVAEGLDGGTMAQTAAIVKFVDIVQPAAGYTTGEAVAQAVADLKDPNADPDAVVKKYFSAEPDIASLANDATLTTLFTAAGMGDLLNQLSGGSN